MVILQVIICVILIVLVLIQTKASGLSASVANSFGAYRSRRGIEKGVFILTIVFGVLFTINSLLLVM